MGYQRQRQRVVQAYNTTCAIATYLTVTEAKRFMKTKNL